VGMAKCGEGEGQMDFSEVVRKRRMVRHFKPDPIPREAVERILDLARRAPSAG
jgi:FMN reductase [NAD(P)H]